MKPCNFQERNCWLPVKPWQKQVVPKCREYAKMLGMCQKCWEGAKGKKCPLKTVTLTVDEKEEAIKSSWGRAQSWWRPSRVWEARVECWWHDKIAWKSNKDKKHRQVKIHNIENKQQHKNLLEVLPSKYHRWEFLTFDFKKWL